MFFTFLLFGFQRTNQFILRMHMVYGKEILLSHRGEKYSGCGCEDWDKFKSNFTVYHT